MNEILKAIKERRSIRKFTSEMPKKEDIEKIIDADGFTLLDVEKKIAKRQLLNIYTDNQKLCVLLFLAGMLNELKEK